MNAGAIFCQMPLANICARYARKKLFLLRVINHVVARKIQLHLFRRKSSPPIAAAKFQSGKPRRRCMRERSRRTRHQNPNAIPCSSPESSQNFCRTTGSSTRSWLLSLVFRNSGVHAQLLVLHIHRKRAILQDCSPAEQKRHSESH